MKSGKYWRKNEKDVMRLLGFKPVPGSGCGWVHKEDGENEYAIAQLKSTEKDSVKISFEDIEKLEYHAAVSHKIPVFVFQFLNRGTYITVNLNDIENLKNLIAGNYSEIKYFEPVIISDDKQPVNEKIVSSKKARNNFYRERENNYERNSKRSNKRNK